MHVQLLRRPCRGGSLLIDFRWLTPPANLLLALRAVNARWELIDYSRVLHDPVDKLRSGFEAVEVLEEMAD